MDTRAIIVVMSGIPSRPAAGAGFGERNTAFTIPRLYACAPEHGGLTQGLGPRSGVEAPGNGQISNYQNLYQPPPS